MKLQTLRIILLIVVAVDALAVLLEAAKDVVVDDALIVILQATLVDGQRLIRDKRRGYQTITDIGVYGVRRHIDAKGFEACPLVVLACIDIYRDGLALRFLGQCVPLVDVGLSVAHDLVIFYSIAGYHLVCLTIVFKTQRCNIHWHRDLLIVWIDGWLQFRLCIFRRH